MFSWYALTIFEMFFEISELSEIVETNEMAKYFYSGYQYLEASLFGIIFGFLFVFINHITDSTRIRALSFGKLIVV